ncbi:MAG: tetratricopeptide repeat protein [Thermodesulfovibrionales bacterium]|nr:tetratricopeptide repeat protein [Thermodesulfovibrionales bacterium]
MDRNGALHMASNYRHKGELEQAELTYRERLKLRPEDPDVYYELGNVLQEKELFHEAADCYRQAIRLHPDFAQAHNRLGNISGKKGDVKEAIAFYQKAVQLDPNLAEAWNNLGSLAQAKGRLDEARKYFRKAARIKPGDYQHHKNLVFSMLYNPRCDAQGIYSEHLRLAKRFEKPLLRTLIPHTNKKTVDRKLRIGYVSPDFRRHSVAYFIEPALSSHNREQFEIFCYSTSASEDEVTHRIQGSADHWKNISGMQEENAADLIRNDTIDILVDLAGHTHNGRLQLFALKPAPVQARWIGYPATTGFSSIEYKIVDGFTDPPGEGERFYTERLVRLPESFLCYLPERDSPEVGDLPALGNEEITFGSFNEFAKTTPAVIKVWASILKRIPNSFLILKAISFKDVSICRSVKEMFARHGIGLDQIELLPFTASFREHLNLYNQIDIGLDPFPYNGTTTTCEALWMGVPVITLEGNRHASRVGVSLLSNIGLSELVAKLEQEYVEKAVDLANDLGRLKSLRGRLRDMMARSPLMNAKGFALNLEDCYRRMWEAWCKKKEPVKKGLR